MGKEQEWKLRENVCMVRGSPSERTCDGCEEVLDAGTRVIVYDRGEEHKVAHSEPCRKKVCEEIGVLFEILPKGFLTRKGEEEYLDLIRREEAELKEKERIIDRELSEEELKEMFGFEKVWNEAGKVFQEWGKILIPQRESGEYWHHRVLFSPEDGKFNLAVDFYKEDSGLILIDPESGEELASMQMPKFRGLWAQPKINLDRGDRQAIEFRQDPDGQEFTLTIESDGRFKTRARVL